MGEIKDSYYISLDKHTVSKVSIPGTVEYEVYATPSDIVRFKELLGENEDRDTSFALVNILFKPFDEVEVDRMRERSDTNLIKAFEFIYTFGTNETREKLKEVGYNE